MTGQPTGLVLANPAAGGGRVDAGELAELFAPHRVQTCAPDELGARLLDALAARPAFVGVAGGDGSVRTAAEVLAGTDVALLVIPGGTRNHFAGSLGIADLATARKVLDTGCVDAVDVGTVNGRVFVNNAVIGQYPAMVRRRRGHDDRLPKNLRTVLALAAQIRHGQALDVVVDRVGHSAWSVFVGNGRYGTTLGDLIERGSLNDGALDVRVVSAGGRLTRLRVVVALATGRLERSALVHTFTTPTVSIELAGPTIDVAVDGEVLHLGAPLTLACRPGALLVYRPPGAG